MKAISKILLVGAIAMGAASSCMKYDFDVDYKAPITITYEGVAENNVMTLEKGVFAYTANITINSVAGLSEVTVYSANNRTGAQGSVLDTKAFYEAEKTATISYDFSGLSDDACIRVSASDIEGHSVAKNLVVAITPAVDFSEDNIIAETAEVYYGVYFASWLSGRVYMRSTDNVASFKNEIDVAFGEVGGVPCIISPAERQSAFNLTNIEGLKGAKVAQTALTAANYNAITKIDASPIETIADPTENKAEIAAGKVYVYLTDDGEKGLIYVKSSEAKSAPVQDVDGNWVMNTPYHKLTISAKSIAK